jgi:hypothetical protein
LSGWSAVAKKVTTQKDGKIEVVWYVKCGLEALDLLERIPEG